MDTDYFLYADHYILFCGAPSGNCKFGDLAESSTAYYQISLLVSYRIFWSILYDAFTQCRSESFKQELMRFLIAVVIIFSLIPTVLQSDPYEMSFGYSLIWLCILYVLGGFIKRYDLFASVGKIKALMVYILCILITWSSKIIIAKITLKVYGEVQYADTLLQYNSPTILIAAIALLIFFSKLELGSSVIKRLIGFFAPASLGVYIIHTNTLIWNYYLYDYAKQFTNCHAILMVIKVVCASLGIYLCCSLIERIRIRLFQVLRIDQLIAQIDKLI